MSREASMTSQISQLQAYLRVAKLEIERLKAAQAEAGAPSWDEEANETRIDVYKREVKYAIYGRDQAI